MKNFIVEYLGRELYEDGVSFGDYVRRWEEYDTEDEAKARVKELHESRHQAAYWSWQ